MTNTKGTFGPKAMFNFWLLRTFMYLLITPIPTLVCAFLLSTIGIMPSIIGASMHILLINSLPIGILFCVGIIWLSLKTLRCKRCRSNLALQAIGKGLVDGYYTTWPVQCKHCRTASKVTIKTSGSNHGAGGAP